MNDHKISMLALGLLFLAGCAPVAIELSPENWPVDELGNYARRNDVMGQPYPIMTAEHAMVAANSELMAVHAGLQALRQGGSAMDAAIATSFAQIAIQAGAGISYAGQMTLIYFDAESGEVSGLDATFATVRGETDPYSIPAVTTPSGRAVLVPGLMRGFEVAHRRFGKLPWRALFDPAIFFARNGVTVSSRFAETLRLREDVLRRLPESRSAFTDRQGNLLGEGAILIQNDLADTLTRVAEEGTDYLYRGDWAHAFVDAVRSDGGKITLEDLAAYEPVWTKPFESSFRQYQLFAPGPPSFGGASTLEAMNLLELANLGDSGSSDAPQTLATLLAVTKVAEMLGPPMAGAYVPQEILDRYFPGVDLTAAARVGKAHASLVWEKMQQPEWVEFVAAADAGRFAGAERIRQLLEVGWGKPPPKEPQKPEHTSGVVAIDEQGNVVALMHSINSSYFGTGLRVGGITVPDAGAYQQELIARIGPGQKLPEPDNPVIALLDGKPVLASSGHGAGIHEVAIQGLLNVLAFGMEPDAAVQVPAFGKNLVPGEPLRLYGGEGGFPLETLRSLQQNGVPIEIVSRPDDASLPGLAVIMKIDPASGKIRVGISRGVNGGGEGF